MGYYRGDYYRGDYYRGDPFALPLIGALGSVAAKVLPGIAKKAIGAVGSLISRPAVAATIGTTAVGAAAGQFIAPRAPALPAASLPPSLSPAYKPRPGVKGKLQRLLPGGESGYIKRRRMNVTNPRALRRAIRRAQGFAKLAKKVLTFTQARAPRGKPLFKRRKR